MPKSKRRHKRTFDNVVFPDIKNMAPELLSDQLLDVQPMEKSVSSFELSFNVNNDSKNPDGPGWEPITLDRPEDYLMDPRGVKTFLRRKHITHEFKGPRNTLKLPASSQLFDKSTPEDRTFFFDAGGWHALAGRAGYVVVRDGNIIIGAQLTRIS